MPVSSTFTGLPVGAHCWLITMLMTRSGAWYVDRPLSGTRRTGPPGKLLPRSIWTSLRPGGVLEVSRIRAWLWSAAAICANVVAPRAPRCHV